MSDKAPNSEGVPQRRCVLHNPFAGFLGVINRAQSNADLLVLPLVREAELRHAAFPSGA